MRVWISRATLALVFVSFAALIIVAVRRGGSASPSPPSSTHSAVERDSDARGSQPPADAESTEPDNSPEGQLVATAQGGDTAGVVALLAEGVSPNSRNRDGRGALHRAAESGSVETLDLLIEAGAEVDGLDGQGFTPLVAAAFAGALPTGLRLLSLGADVDGQREPHLVTALEQAVAGWHAIDGTEAISEDRRRFVEALLNAGADPNLGSAMGPPIRFLPSFRADEALVAMFFDHGAQLDELPHLWVLERLPGPVGQRIGEAVRAAKRRAETP